MKRLFLIIFVIGVFSVVLGTSGLVMAGEPGIRLGVLVCDAIPGSGYNLIITSSVDVKCIFDDGHGGKERYVGETGIGLGVNLNFKSRETIAFTVIGVSSDYKTGSYAMAGKYVGAKASATVGVGVGAAVLVGGGEKNFSLQPLALEANQGFGAAAGLGYLYIEPAVKRRK